MTMATTILILVLVWMFKGSINKLVSTNVETLSEYSKAANYHAKRVSEFTRVDSEYAEEEAKIRAKARIKSLKESHKDLPEL